VFDFFFPYRKLAELLQDPDIKAIELEHVFQEMDSRLQSITSVMDITGLMGSVFAPRVAHAFEASRKLEGWVKYFIFLVAES
jgi:hypothetical protein